LIAAKTRPDNFPRTILITPPLNTTHQIAEPRNTPRIIEIAPACVADKLSKPTLVKSAVKNSIVIGLVIVKKKEETKTEDYKTIRKEFSFRSFKRSFNLDDRINSEAIQAKYENGVLKLYLPKKEQEKESTKQISIQ